MSTIHTQMGLSPSSRAKPLPNIEQDVADESTKHKPSEDEDPKKDAPNTNINNKDRNPGTLSDLHRKCSELMPVSFGGLKILLNNYLSSHFQTAHLINLNNHRNNIDSHESSGYKFNTTYIGTGRLNDSPVDRYPVFFGDIDTNGNVNANVVHFVTSRFCLKYNGQFRNSNQTTNQKNQAQIMAEYFGSDYTLSMIAANLNRDREPEILVGQYLMAVTEHLAVGTELSYNNASVPRFVPLAKRLDLTVACRVETSPEASWSLTWGPLAGLHLSTYQKASETLQIGVDAMMNPANNIVVTRLGYQASMPNRNFVFRGMMDSNGGIGSSLEKGFHPFPLTFTISTFINQRNNQFRLGCGIVLK